MFHIISKLTVGRETDCDIVLDDPKVSRHHGEFLREGDEIHFKDNGSTNGSLHNGKRVSDRVKLELGDILKLGGCEMALLEHTDLQAINIVGGETMITGFVDTDSISADILAEKVSKVFDHYKSLNRDLDTKEIKELDQLKRLFGGMRSIYTISQSMGKLMPMEELLEMIGASLFKVFHAAENLVILLKSDEKNRLVPRYVTSRNRTEAPKVVISSTVLDKAAKEKRTIIANDAENDERFSGSDSIIGFAVKSVICAPLISGGKVLGALYLDNRTEFVTYDELDAELVSAFANQCAVAVDNSFLLDNLQEHYHQTLQALVNAIEAKDTYTMGHTARVSRYSVGIARAIGFSEERTNRIKMAADLHDIGKIGIKERIINKPGALTDTEYSSIKDHVEMGEKILAPITYLRDLLPAIRGHHEKWDGSGYPDGLKGEECPIEGRILALADAFDAMTSQRSYNKPLSFEQALDRIKEAAGTHFDPKVVNAFERFLRSEYLAPDSKVTAAAETPSSKKSSQNTP